jgi:hypothetical protein
MLTKYLSILGGFTVFDDDPAGGGGGANPAPAADPKDAPAGGDDPAKAATPASGDEPYDEERAKAKISKANSEAANLRKRLKELEPLAKRARELEDAQKSESEKLTDAKTTAEREAASAKAEVARLRVAIEKGLTAVQAKRLVGETEEELAADADELLASFKSPEDDPKPGDDPKDPKPDIKRRPTEKLTPGSVPEVDPDEETDPRKLAEGLPSYS